VLYDGAMTRVYSTQNKGQAMINGFYANAKFSVTKQLTISGNFISTRGRVRTGGVETPLDHIAPLSARFNVDYKKNKFSAGLWMLMNGTKKISDYLLNAEDNEQYATPNGMPAWQCINLRVGYAIHPNLNIQLACENILDTNYRVFASGISAPGRNFKVTLRGTI
jgi:hemoglobin/transferrin/lactoferrin receptor protein